jgi:NADPH-dependent glutamate synthase beta subunit-like oxidoreductase
MAFGKKSTDSAEAIDVDSMVAAGDLPDDPKVINAIKSGRVDAKAFSADWKQEQASLAQTPSPAPSALDTSIVNSKITPQKVDLNLPVPVDQAPDKIVQGMVAAGDLPDDPKVLEAIKSGRVNAKAFSKN